MAQDPLKPKDSGRIRQPQYDSAMVKVPSRPSTPDDKGAITLGSKPPESDAAKKEKLLTKIRKRMEKAISAESENRKSGLDDKLFKAGDQWPKEIQAQRNLDKRPCLTINKLPTFVHQIVNDQRQNRPSISISPVGDKGDPEVAKMFRGLIRFIERDCAADIAYDTAFDDAVTMGWGYWRILTEPEAPDSMDDVIVVQRIRNAFTVYMDPSAQDPTGADAKWAFITEMMARDEFEERYPDANPLNFTEGGIGEKFTSWVAKDEIRIAEYFEIEHEMRTLVELDNGHVGWRDELDDITKANIKRGRVHIVEERESRVPTVMWYKVTAVDILKKTKWLGSTIPIVKVIGDEIDIEGKPKYSGIIRHAKDPQRMVNYWRPLALNTPLPTPTGWTTMGDAKEGDWLLDDQGKPTSVVGTSPVHLFRDCYRVEFDDGSHIIADAKHPWQVEERGKRMTAGDDWRIKIVTTAELTPKKHFIYGAMPIELPEMDLPIHPYLLGVWLGDGLSAEPQICASDHEMDEVRANLMAVGCNLSPVRRSGDRIGVFTVYGLRSRFTALGLLGNKHIPPQYLRASREQREALLQGLMDTDGSISRATRQCSLTTTIPALADGFAELLRTLGIKAINCKRPARRMLMPGGYVSDCKEAQQFSFTALPGANIFRLGHKSLAQKTERTIHLRRTQRHRITSVQPVPSVPVKCVAIDAPSHLFLAGTGMVPTHNTSETELVALQPKAPWIVEEGQIEGHEDEWKGANVRNQPYLSYKGTSVGGTQAPPPQRQPMAGIPAGVVQAGVNAAQDMMATTGIRFDATMNERMIDESGKAIRELRRSGDLGAFHYVDNLARSLRRTGEIFVELIPKIYNERRVLTILREDDKEEQVRIDPHMGQPTGEEKKPDGKTMKVFNPSAGKYGVTVTIGPSYATKRIEATENMMAFMKALPQTAGLVADLFAKNSDWPGAEEIAARLAKTLPPGLLQPDMKDVPPQIQAILTQQETAIKELTQNLQQAMAALQDKKEDREVEIDAINKKFEAALLKVVADTETKMASIEEKAVANHNTHLAAQMKEITAATTAVMDGLSEEASNQGAPANDQLAAREGSDVPPPEAVAHLRPGRITTFANGSKWTVGPDGVPVKKS